MQSAKSSQAGQAVGLEITDSDINVSSVSRFDDPVWNMDGWRPGSNGRALFQWRWDFAMSDGSRFTDDKWLALALTAKCYLLSLQNDPPLARMPVRTGTQGSRYQQLRVLIAWMDDENLRSFADIDQDTANRFMEDMARRPGKKGRGLVPATLASYSALLKTLFLQGPKISGGILNDPFPGQNSNQVVGGGRHARGTSPYTPDEIAVQLISAAVRLIGTPADDIIALRNAAQQTYDDLIHQGLSQSKAGIATGMQIEGHDFSTLKNEELPWHEPMPASTKEVRYLVDRIVDACFIVIAYLAGLRVSEILNLTPGCIIEIPSEDGSENVAYLDGRIFKTAFQKEGIPHRWVAPEPVVRAIAVMEQISEPYRRLSMREELFQTMSSSGLIGPNAAIATPTTATWNNRLSRLFASFIHLQDYKGEAWRITSHQGRKTFARFVGKRDRTGLHALQKHFGHITRVMTDTGYVGTDFVLEELVDHQTLLETHDALEALLTSRRLAGPAGRTIAARSPFRGRTIDKEVSLYATWVINETDMRLGVCDWGFCVYRRETAACRGGEKGPNPTLRTESVCLGCKNFSVTDRHVSFWEARLARNTVLLGRDDLDPVSRDLAQTRVEETHRLLEELRHDELFEEK